MSSLFSSISGAVKGVWAPSGASSGTTGALPDSNTATDAPLPMKGDVFNLNERQTQIKAGIPDKTIVRLMKAIRKEMPDQHRKMFEERTLVYVAVEAEDAGALLATGVLVGPAGDSAGFMSTPDSTTVLLDLSVAAAYGFSPTLLRKGASVGILGLEHETRRRNRVNGRVAAASESSVTVTVDQSFGNCPKYIQKRPVQFDAARLEEAKQTHPHPAEDRVVEEMRQLIRAADTFMVGSMAAKDGGKGGPHGVDMSHRGGPAGFVHVSSDGKQITWPEYPGNDFFMSLGNIVATGGVGLLFIDYESGAAVTVDGYARIDWEDQSLPGAERAVVLDVAACRLLPPGSIPLKGGPVTEWSPRLPTG